MFASSTTDTKTISNPSLTTENRASYPRTSPAGLSSTKDSIQMSASAKTQEPLSIFGKLYNMLCCFFVSAFCILTCGMIRIKKDAPVPDQTAQERDNPETSAPTSQAFSQAQTTTPLNPAWREQLVSTESEVLLDEIVKASHQLCDKALEKLSAEINRSSLEFPAQLQQALKDKEGRKSTEAIILELMNEFKTAENDQKRMIIAIGVTPFKQFTTCVDQPKDLQAFKELLTSTIDKDFREFLQTEINETKIQEFCTSKKLDPKTPYLTVLFCITLKNNAVGMTSKYIGLDIPNAWDNSGEAWETTIGSQNRR